MRARVERQTDETFRQQLEKLYREKKQKIYRAAYGITGNRQDAQDALQNVFVRLMQRPPSSDFNKDPEGYLCRAGINEALSMGRRRERQKLADANVNDLDIPLAAAVWGAGDGHAEHLEDMDRRLRLARDQLDPYLAAIITLHYDLKCEVALIARIFRRACPTIGMHLWRARRELGRLMSTSGGNNEMA
jgi:RNA polymerase sigma-70 factor, ECF subfamily